MNDSLQYSFKWESYTIEVHLDPYRSINPRQDYDHLGVISYWHRRHAIGEDRNGLRLRETLHPELDYLPDWPPTAEEMEDSGLFYLPVYIYEHGGIALSTRPFNCRWDGGQLGWIWSKDPEATKEILEAEVKEFGDWISGRVYGYVVKDPDGEEVNSCWGFIGEPEESGLIEEAKMQVEFDIENKKTTCIGEGI